MGYLHINNLYKEQTILLFKECYALEKIHGTSAHIGFTHDANGYPTGRVTYFSGGESHEKFKSLFNEQALIDVFSKEFNDSVTVYGEAYGGKQQGMSETYGKVLKFVVFDVQVGDKWLSVPQAEEVAKKLGLEFVYYTKIPTDLASLDAARDADSQQAVRNGVGAGKKMEGVVLRPLIEMTLNNGSRIICKHKRDEFRETASPRPVVDPAQLQVLEDAEKIANEWVTPMRLQHVLDKIPNHSMENMKQILASMVDDVWREAGSEIVQSIAVAKAITRRTSKMYQDLLKSQIGK